MWRTANAKGSGRPALGRRGVRAGEGPPPSLRAAASAVRRSAARASARSISSGPSAPRGSWVPASSSPHRSRNMSALRTAMKRLNRCVCSRRGDAASARGAGPAPAGRCAGCASRGPRPRVPPGRTSRRGRRSGPRCPAGRAGSSRRRSRPRTARARPSRPVACPRRPPSGSSRPRAPRPAVCTRSPSGQRPGPPPTGVAVLVGRTKQRLEPAGLDLSVVLDQHQQLAASGIAREVGPRSQVEGHRCVDRVEALHAPRGLEQRVRGAVQGGDHLARRVAWEVPGQRTHAPPERRRVEGGDEDRCAWLGSAGRLRSPAAGVAERVWDQLRVDWQPGTCPGSRGHRRARGSSRAGLPSRRHCDPRARRRPGCSSAGGRARSGRSGTGGRASESPHGRRTA